MPAKLTLTPAVNIANRREGFYGAGEVVTLSYAPVPAAPGGVTFKITQGSGKLSVAAQPPGTAVFTAANKAEKVCVSVLSGSETLATAGFTIVTPDSLTFKSTGAHHTNGQAQAAFDGDIYLGPPGVSYEAIEVREGEFKGRGSGYYAYLDNKTHPPSAAPATIINGNKVNGFDTIDSGANAAPYSPGRFDWNIPWQYRIAGTAEWTTFAYANHVQEINALGRVSIGKFNAGPFSASVNDPTS